MIKKTCSVCGQTRHNVFKGICASCRVSNRKRPAVVGRPNELGETKLIAVRIPITVAQVLSDTARDRGISVSELVRSILYSSIR